MTTTVDAPGPVFVDLPSDQALHANPPMAEIWYVTCVVDGEGPRRYGVQAILTSSISGRLFASLSMVELGTQHQWHAIDRFDQGSASVSTEQLAVLMPTASLSGTTDEMTFHVEIAGNTADLTLGRQYPVLYNCGTGLFPYFHGPTHQYAFPGLAVSGTITVDGQPLHVHGGGWYDRQWSASRDAFGTKQPFTWFGLCLENGHNLSVWNTTGPDGGGKIWATVVQPDGKHSVVKVVSAAHEGWTLSLPSLDAILEVAHVEIHNEPGFYSGICDVEGTYEGAPIRGYGVVDHVPH
jgi:predicted secreted hydrolase